MEDLQLAAGASSLRRECGRQPLAGKRTISRATPMQLSEIALTVNGNVKAP